MFHKLLFLGPGGRTVYQGSVEGAKEYFDGMGYPCPANINPADHYMDVIGGVMKKSNEKFNPVVLFDAWVSHAKERESMQVNEKDTVDGVKSDSLQVLIKPGMNSMVVIIQSASMCSNPQLHYSYAYFICLCIQYYNFCILFQRQGIMFLPIFKCKVG